MAQIIFLDKIPQSAAVNEAVKAAGSNERARSYINAVLRALTREDLPPVRHESPRALLALRYSHPRWYVTYLARRYGDGAAIEALEADNTPPGVYCVVNTLRASAADVIGSIRSEGGEVTESVGNPECAFELRSSGAPNKYSAFRDGLFYIQDPSAFRAAQLCRPASGDVIFDMCASPGGKTFALTILSQGKSHISAFDLPARIELIKEGADRLKMSGIKIFTGDASVPDKTLSGKADIVLCDVPCSGFGVVRKKPEIRYKPEESIAELPKTQMSIISNCGRYVKPGGRLVYSTCTTLKSENEDVVDAFLASNPAFSETLRENILPTLNSDGFFASVMVKSPRESGRD